MAGRSLFTTASRLARGRPPAIAAQGIPAVERASLGAAARSTTIVRAGILGATEAIIVLVVVDLVVGLFVVLQVAYLFGGQSTLVAVGLTYSDYARRGFFELVAAACLAGAVVVALETTVERRTRPYVAALLALIGLTAVVLVSATLRLRLYQDAYGWTELRLYVLTTIAALGAALVVMVALVLLGRMRWLGHGLAVIGVVSLVGLNLVRARRVRGRAERRADPRPEPRPARRPCRARCHLPRRAAGRCDPGPRRGAAGPPDARAAARSRAAPAAQAELGTDPAYGEPGRLEPRPRTCAEALATLPLTTEADPRPAERG